MTQARFKRLFIVLLGPLLVLGAIVGLNISYGPDQAAAYIFCEREGSGHECINLGDAASLNPLLRPTADDFTISERPEGSHSIIYAESRSVSAETIRFGSAWRVSLGGYYTPKEKLGPIITIDLSGDLERDGSVDRIICSELDISKAQSGVFIANNCTSYLGILQGVEFRVRGQDKQMLDSLVNAVLEETSAEDARRLGQVALITPIFVLLFLAVSGLIWLILRARAYVLAA